jgi:hypothetical protein
VVLQLAAVVLASHVELDVLLLVYVMLSVYVIAQLRVAEALRAEAQNTSTEQIKVPFGRL